jgi:hypothetical protein
MIRTKIQLSEQQAARLKEPAHPRTESVVSIIPRRWTRNISSMSVNPCILIWDKLALPQEPKSKPPSRSF